MRTFVVDNGAYNLKAGYSNDQEPIVVPNFVVKCRSDKTRVYVADEVKNCQDKSKLYYMLPCEKGYTVNWNVQLEVWDRIFGPNMFNVQFAETDLLLTDINTMVPALRDTVDEIIFECYQFHGFYRQAAPSLIALHEDFVNKNPACIVVDSGYSFTHVVPAFDGGVIGKGIMRIDVGGKALTNQLKEWVTYRQVDVRDETYVMNQCKEDVCYVAMDFKEEMAKAEMPYDQNPIVCEYVLPDFLNTMRGTMQSYTKTPSEHQKLRLTRERFQLTELLFTPSDIGMNQAGVAESVAHSVAEVAKSFPDIGDAISEHVLCVGGNVNFNGFVDRLRKDLTPFLPDDNMPIVSSPPNPTTYAWQCAAALVEKRCPDVVDHFVSRLEYLEHGEARMREKFDNFFSY